jgi:hypothetical protein
MATTSQKQEVLQYWNEKKIIQHRILTHEANNQITLTLKHYSMDEVKEMMDLYATILEPGTPEEEKTYFWTHKWNLYEFLKRGVPKFYGQEASSYKKRHSVQTPEAIVFKRK